LSKKCYTGNSLDHKASKCPDPQATKEYKKQVHDEHCAAHSASSTSSGKTSTTSNKKGRRDYRPPIHIEQSVNLVTLEPSSWCFDGIHELNMIVIDERDITALRYIQLILLV
jgi:hypothetical protein